MDDFGFHAGHVGLQFAHAPHDDGAGVAAAGHAVALGHPADGWRVQVTEIHRGGGFRDRLRFAAVARGRVCAGHLQVVDVGQAAVSDGLQREGVFPGDQIDVQGGGLPLREAARQRQGHVELSVRAAIDFEHARAGFLAAVGKADLQRMRTAGRGLDAPGDPGGFGIRRVDITCAGVTGAFGLEHHRIADARLQLLQGEAGKGLRGGVSDESAGERERESDEQPAKRIFHGKKKGEAAKITRERPRQRRVIVDDHFLARKCWARQAG